MLCKDLVAQIQHRRSDPIKKRFKAICFYFSSDQHVFIIRIEFKYWLAIWRQHLNQNPFCICVFLYSRLFFGPCKRSKTETQRGMSFVLLTHVLVYLTTYSSHFSLSLSPSFSDDCCRCFYSSPIMYHKNIFDNFQTQELNAFGSMIKVTHNNIYIWHPFLCSPTIFVVCLYSIFV